MQAAEEEKQQRTRHALAIFFRVRVLVNFVQMRIVPRRAALRSGRDLDADHGVEQAINAKPRADDWLARLALFLLLDQRLGADTLADVGAGIVGSAARRRIAHDRNRRAIHRLRDGFENQRAVGDKGRDGGNLEQQYKRVAADFLDHAKAEQCSIDNHRKGKHATNRPFQKRVYLGKKFRRRTVDRIAQTARHTVGEADITLAAFGGFQGGFFFAIGIGVGGGICGVIRGGWGR